MFNITKEQLVSFELSIADLFERGELPYLTHLCGGNEDQLIEIFKRISEGDYILSTHRTHYHYLLAGGSKERLKELIKSGNSMFVFDKSINFLCSSILAGNTGIAAGIALALKRQKSKKHVWCFVGDGAEEEGHFYEAVRFVDGHNLPCTFIIEDNSFSVDTHKNIRRGKSIIQWPSCVETYEYERIFPHASTGYGNIITFNQEVVEKYKHDHISK